MSLNIPVWSGGALVEDTQDNPLYATAEFQSLFNQLLSTLAMTFTSDGWLQGGNTQAQIVAAGATAEDGTFWLDTDNQALVVKFGGSLFQTPITTPYP